VPDRYAKTYQAWLENLRDWPISRQLWWGHRIPVWAFDLKHPNFGYFPAEETVAKHEQWAREFIAAFCEYVVAAGYPVVDFSFRIHGEPFATTAYVCVRNDSAGDLLNIFVNVWQTKNAVTDGDRPETSSSSIPRDTEIARGAFSKLIDYIEGVRQDEDVLDTWFSSALWPFSTMGWPDETPELQAYYPSNVLCTAREIITLWVSRMVMMGQYCVGGVPFPDVFIHAMIQDGEGRKMSKSLGNGINPLDIIDSHGADAMRFTLAAMTTQTQDVRMPVSEMTTPGGRSVNSSPKFDIGRNFCNKLWNAARFAMMNLADCPAFDAAAATDLADRWILSRLAACVRQTTDAIEGYRYNELADGLYHFMWDDFCDWYLEIAKARINAGEDAPKAVVALCLDHLLRLLHPVCPFITEAIWAKLNETAPNRGPSTSSGQAEPLLARAAWPAARDEWIDPASEQRFALLQDLIRKARNVRKEHNIPPGKAVDALVEAAGDEADLITANTGLLQSQANLGLVSAGTACEDGTTATVASGAVKLHVLGVIDREAELARLTKQRDQLAKGIAGIEKKLASEGFVSKAPADVVERERQRLADLTEQLATVERALGMLQA